VPQVCKVDDTAQIMVLQIFFVMYEGPQQAEIKFINVSNVGNSKQQRLSRTILKIGTCRSKTLQEHVT
jgi:hypothetical protein